MQAKLSLKQIAAKAGVSEELDSDQYEVYAHGTTGESGQKMLDTQGTCLTPAGGAHNGQFFTVPDVAIAEEFAKRTCGRHPGQKPMIVGLAIPQSLANTLKRDKLLTPKFIPNPPPGVPLNSVEHVFSGGALERVARDGFFFKIS